MRSTGAPWNQFALLRLHSLYCAPDIMLRYLVSEEGTQDVIHAPVRITSDRNSFYS
jgi:hypothetical protein